MRSSFNVICSLSKWSLALMLGVVLTQTAVAAPGDIKTLAGGALFDSPNGIHVTQTGDIYLADTFNHRVVKIGAKGAISTVAGNGVRGAAGDGGPAAAANLDGPINLAMDNAGNLYIADIPTATDWYTPGIRKVRKVDANGNISTVIAGTGSVGGNSCIRLATDTYFNNTLQQVLLDPSGRLHVIANGLWRLEDNGTLTNRSDASCGNGSLQPGFMTGYFDASSGAFVYWDADTHLVFSTSDFQSSIIVGNNVGTSDVVFMHGGGAGYIIVANPKDNKVYRIASAGTTFDLAGIGTAGYSGDGGNAIDAQLNGPAAVFADPANQNVYVVDRGNNCIRKIDPMGKITTVAGAPDTSATSPAASAPIRTPRGVFTDTSGNVYVADTYNHRIRKIDPTGMMTNIAGNGYGDYCGDNGPAVDACLFYPSAIFVDSAGNVYIADTMNDRIRKVDTSGIISTVIGTSISGYSGDGGSVANALLNAPTGVAVNGWGDLLFSDSGNNAVRTIDSAGNLYTRANVANPRGLAVDSQDGLYIASRGEGVKKIVGGGGLVSLASCNDATGVAVDFLGNVYAACPSDNIVMQINGGSSVVVAGTGIAGFSGDGGPAIGAALSSPWAVSTEPYGTLSIADAGNDRVRGRESNYPDYMPPMTVASPHGGKYAAPVSVTLTCGDGLGLGCWQTFYCIGAGCDPKTPYNYYGGPFIVSIPNVVRFHSIDFNGNIEGVREENYTASAPASVPPVAEAGSDQNVQVALIVTLDGRGSYDPDGTIMSYNWVQTAGTPVSLSGPDTATPDFISPGLTGALMFLLTVTDNSGLTASDTVSVFVNDCSGSGDLSIVSPDSTQQNGSSMNDLGEIVWSQFDPGTGRLQIYSSARGYLTNDQNDHLTPSINNRGDVVWEQHNSTYPYDITIRGLISGQLVQLTYGPNDWHPSINDKEEMVYIADYQVVSSVRGQLTNDVTQHFTPSINNNGDVVWTQPDETGWRQVYELAAGSLVSAPVTTGALDHGTPSINILGEVVWSQGNVGAQWLYSNIRGRLTFDCPSGLGHSQPSINSCGDITFTNFWSAGGVIYRLGNKTPCVSDTEPNNYLPEATLVSGNSTTIGMVQDPGDLEDWYKFTANAGAPITVTVNWAPTASPNTLVVDLMDQYGGWLAGAQPGSPKTITYTAMYSGTYYVHIMATPGSRIGYTLTLKVGIGGGTCADPVAPSMNMQDYGTGMNDLGEVVWAESNMDVMAGYHQIMSSSRGQLTNEPTDHMNPSVNNRGDVVWEKRSYDGYQWVAQIWGLISGQLQQLSFPVGNNSAYGPSINDYQEVVWFQKNGPNYQIYSNQRGWLTSDPTDHTEPGINNAGDVVWSQMDPGGGQIYKLAAGTTTPVAVTSNPTNHMFPSISNSGEVVWSEDNGSGSNRIYSSTRGQVTFDGCPYGMDHAFPSVNACGDVTFNVYGNTTQVYRLGSASPCVSDAEPNNYLAEATLVSGNSTTMGMAQDPGDLEDWYKFTANAGDPITVTVNWAPTASPNTLVVDLMDQYGGWLAGAQPGSPKTITYTAIYSGTYHVHLMAMPGSRIGYTLTLKVGIGGGACADPVSPGPNMWSSSLNDLGEVVWSQFDPGTGHQQVYSSMRGQLTNDQNDHINPSVNNRGDVVWEQNGQIYGTLSGQLIQFTYNGGYQPSINDSGEVVWQQTDFETGRMQICSNVRGKLTSDATDHYNPSVNNRGDVVWEQYDGTSSQIYGIINGVPAQITTGQSWHMQPSISNSGEVVWSQGSPGSNNYIYSSTRGQLTFGCPSGMGHNEPSVNACGDLTFTNFENNGPTIYRLGNNAPCVSDTEPNDSMSNPVLISGNTTTIGMLNGTSDLEDWYRFTANAGDTVKIWVNWSLAVEPNWLFVELRDNGGAVLVNAPESGSPKTITYTAMNSGDYYVHIMTPPGGKIAYALSVTVKDVTPPTVSISSPTAGITSNNRPVLHYAVSDGTVTVKVDGIVVTKVSGDALDALQDGQHTVRVQSTDAAGNMGFAEISFTIDATAPIVTITSPGAGVAFCRTPLLEYIVSEGVAVVKVDGAVVAKVSGTTLDPLVPGAHSVVVEATDAAGNTGSAEVNFTIQTAVPVAIEKSKISAGSSHTVVLRSDGTLWVWGYNYFGQLGDTTSVNKRSPVQIGTDADWISVVAGGFHTVALKSDGTLWAWGYNNFGQLGDTTTDDKHSPVQIGSDTNWVGIAAGGSHTVGLKSDGTLWAWGANYSGQLGDGSTVNKISPVKIGNDASWVSISAGDDFTVALKSDGTLWAWGMNWGQLGDGTKVDKHSPVQIGLDNTWSKIAAGGYHTLAIKADGTLWTWGYNYYGQLGDGSTYEKLSPSRLGNEAGWVLIAAGSDFSMAANSYNMLYTWGHNNYGQLGNGEIVDRHEPYFIGVYAPEANGLVSMDAGGSHSLILTEMGGLSSWGSNYYGQVGLGIISDNVLYAYQVLDKVVKNGAVSINKGVSYVHEASVTVDYMVSDVSGVAEMQFSNDGISWSALEPYAPTKDWALTPGDGTKTVYVKFKDNAGYWSQVYTASVVLDTTTPVVTISSPIPGGVYNHTPLLQYTTHDGASVLMVIVKVDGVRVFNNLGEGPNGLSDGTHVVRVEATDPAGNVGFAEATFTIDTIAPAVTITSPATGVSNVNAPALTYSVGDGSVVVKVDSVIVSKTSGSVLDLLADGAHTVRVEATDQAGNTDFAEVAFTVDTIAPIVAISLPVAGVTNNTSLVLTYTADEGIVIVKVDGVVVQKVSGDTLNALADGSHTVRVESSDPAGNLGLAEVTFVVDTVSPAVSINQVTTPTNVNAQTVTGTRESGALVAVALNTSATAGAVSYPTNTTWNCAINGLVEGVNIVTVTATDAAGNIAPAATSITYDSVAPTVVISSPSAATTNNNKPVLGYTASDGTVIVKVDGNAVQKISGDMLDLLADGVHTVRIEATDLAGNTGYAEVAFVVDTVPPTVTVNPVTSPTRVNAQTIGGSRESGAIITVSVDTSASLGSLVYPTDAAWSSTVTGLVEGVNNITITATDGAQNITTVRTSITYDSIAPAVTVSSPVSGVTNNKTPLLSYAITGGTLSIVSLDGVIVSKTSGQNLDALADGSHTLRVNATDEAGNTAYAEVTFTVDTVPPVISISSPAAGVTIRNKLPLAYTATDGVVTVRVDGVVVNKVSGNTLDVLANGTHTVRVDARDSANNIGFAEITFTVNYTPLAVDTTSLGWGVTGVAYSRGLAASGGVPPYTWSITDGALPAGLNLDLSIGAISGTPTAAGSSTLTVQVQDGDLVVATRSLTINIYNPLVITKMSLTAGFVGASYSEALTASGGMSPYTWSILSGSLPAGLTLNSSTGAISGTPTTTGTSTFTVQAQDGNMITAAKLFTTTIDSARADLIVSALSGPGSGTKGTKISVTGTVKNQGQVTSASSTLTFYLSTDAFVTTSDIKLGDKTINNLTAGGSQTVTVNVTIPSTTPQGTYYIAAIADRSGVIAETDESNNSRVGNTIIIN